MKKTNPKRPASHVNQLRIIGGQWRGRKLSFPTLDGLRPTPDRVRETLFNWLSPSVVGAHCLDLFAGSGALGLEALSRGAASCDFVDNSRLVDKQLKRNLALLNCQSGRVYTRTADLWLQDTPNRHHYQIVFLDPPFHQGLVAGAFELIHQHQLLANQAWVYLETARGEALPSLPANWHLHREKIAGQICYRLFAIDSTKDA